MEIAIAERARAATEGEGKFNRKEAQSVRAATEKMERSPSYISPVDGGEKRGGLALCGQ